MNNMKKIKFILLYTFLLSGIVYAQNGNNNDYLEYKSGTTSIAHNPICPMGVYIADPTSRVAPDGRLYIYGSLDTTPERYCSKDYHVLSTSDLKNWTLNRYSFSDNEIIYAPDMMLKNGTYYLYYEHPNGDEFVAESDSPIGPFKNGIKIEGPNQIDPNVFIDDDGQAYYFWGQFSAKGAKMNPDMKTIDMSTYVDGIVTEKEHFFHEGSYVIKRGKYYYFIYADISRNSRPTCIGYSMATSPFGPYEYKGIIIDNAGCDPETWNNHGSIVEYQGQWYVIYHRSTHGSKKMRKACIEPIHFNDDGTINEVEMTSQGASGPLNAFDKIDAATACKMHGNVRIQRMKDRNDREQLACIHHGDGAIWKYIDFGKGAKNISLRVQAQHSGRIILRRDNSNGKVIGVVKVQSGNEWETITTKISNVNGIHALYMKFESDQKDDNEDLFALDWFQFHEESVITPKSEMENIRNGFKNIPDSIQTAVYWYWLNNNISREGVVKDLEAMKRVGINRAFIGNQATEDLPYGNNKLFSDEWWNVTRQALKTASELGIQIGMFNCPGWSQSGGPWVKPEESMKYVRFDEHTIIGNGENVSIKLPEIDRERIICVLAYPSINGASQSWKVNPSNKITLKLDKPFTARTISIQSNKAYRSVVHLLSNGKEITSFEFDRHNINKNVGFEPLAPYYITIPETFANEFDLTFEQPNSNVEITITLSEIPAVEKYAEKSLAKVFQDPLPMWDYYMWNTPAEATNNDLYINPEKIINITGNIKDREILWEAPNGKWTILTAYMETTGVTNSPAVEEGTGLEVDKINKQYIASHFNSYIGDIIRRIPAEDRKTWNIVVEDSYETGSLNWTDGMEKRFRETYGYDPIPFLPTLKGIVIGSVDKSERFLWDLRRLIADRVAYDYVGGLRDECHKHGMTTWLENYGHWGFPGEFLMYGGQSDEVSGEFWSEGTLGDIENRAASSCAHIYGKKKVWAESCTAGGPQYDRYPRLMKQRVDRFFCEGINASLLHLFIQQPDDRKPGLDAWFGNEFNRNNTWFEGMGSFINYLKRCCFILQQGQYIADVAYFIGEDVPKMTGVCDPALPKGYSFDYINAEVLMKNSRVENGKLVLNSGMKYRVLVLPKQETMRPEVLNRIHDFATQGLTIVGPTPLRSPSLQNYPVADDKVRKLSDIIWNETGKCGKGRIYKDGTTMETIFAEQDIEPDFMYDGEAQIAFIHRKLEEGDIYFISNQQDKEVTINTSFRIGNCKNVEFWNPQTGEIIKVECTIEGNRTTLKLHLDKLESVFVVFSNSDSSVIATSEVKKIEMDNTSWDVYFSSSVGKPSFTKTFTKLIDWSKADDENIKYYSGKAIYKNTFTLNRKDTKTPRIKINLGEVMVIGSIRINDKDVGGVWTYPYEANISNYVHEGLNNIEIIVYNNWKNRLIADEKLPEDLRQTWTNIQPWKKNDELQSSGLLGPVTIEIYE